MKKRIVLAVLAAAMVMSMAACGQKSTTNQVKVEPIEADEADTKVDVELAEETEPVKADEEAGAEGVEGAEEPEAGETEAGTVNITVQMLTEEEYEDKKAEGVQLAESGEKEYAAHILVTFDQDVSSFILWSLFSDFQDGADEPLIEEETALAEIEQIKAGESVIVTTSLGEILPTAGFSYVDADGLMRYCYLGESGKDGSAFYEEYSITPTDN